MELAAVDERVLVMVEVTEDVAVVAIVAVIVLVCVEDPVMDPVDVREVLAVVVPVVACEVVTLDEADSVAVEVAVEDSLPV